jgi:hypothetical protein
VLLVEHGSKSAFPLFDTLDQQGFVGVDFHSLGRKSTSSTLPKPLFSI